MKNATSKKVRLAAVAVTALLWAVPASAQTRAARIDVPFPFVAGNEVLPAGQYELVMDDFARIMLRSTTETDVHFVGVSGKYERRTSTDLAPATLRFNRYAGTMFLTAAWAPGREDGKGVRLSGRLTEAMRASLRGNSAESVTLDSGLK